MGILCIPLVFQRQEVSIVWHKTWRRIACATGCSMSVLCLGLPLLRGNSPWLSVSNYVVPINMHWWDPTIPHVDLSPFWPPELHSRSWWHAPSILGSPTIWIDVLMHLYSLTSPHFMSERSNDLVGPAGWMRPFMSGRGTSLSGSE